MSIKVMTWVWDHAQVKGGELLLLLAIADHADDEGRNAWPSLNRLVERTRVDRRTVQRLLRSLERNRLIMIEPSAGPHRTNRYTVLIQSNRDSGDYPQGVYNPVAKEAERHPGNMPPAAPSPSASRHLAAQRVAPAPPNPSTTAQEPSTLSDVCPAKPATEELPTSGHTDALAVLDALGPEWSLTVGQRQQLATRITTALAAGWPATGLIARLSANPRGVRSPAAVLTTRLADLPPPTRLTPKPPWCGVCDETTRHHEQPNGALARCPTCHPLHDVPL